MLLSSPQFSDNVVWRNWETYTVRIQRCYSNFILGNSLIKYTFSLGWVAISSPRLPVFLFLLVASPVSTAQHDFKQPMISTYIGRSAVGDRQQTINSAYCLLAQQTLTECLWYAWYCSMNPGEQNICGPRSCKDYSQGTLSANWLGNEMLKSSVTGTRVLSTQIASPLCSEEMPG